MTMQEIVAAENELILSTFSLDDAWELGMLARRVCMERKLPMTISVEQCGRIAFQCALEGTSPDNDRWMVGKRRAVQLTHHSSLWSKEKLIMKEEKSPEIALGISSLEYRCNGGSIPIQVAGIGVVGSLTLSGLKDTEDHALAMELLRMFRDGR